MKNDAVKSIAIIGASGFVGSALLTACEQRGITAVATSRSQRNSVASKGVGWLHYDLADEPERLLGNLHDCEWVVCVAGTAHVAGEQQVYQREAARYAQLFDALLAAGKKIIYLSSVKAADGDDGYSLAKRQLELYLQSKPDESWIVLRPALVYGSGMKGFLAQWQGMLRTGWMPRLPEVNNQRSLVAIDNLISAIFFVMREPRCLRQIVAVTDSKAYSTGELQQSLMLSVRREWRLPAMPLLFWKALAGLGELLPFLPFNKAHYQRLFADANYQDDKLIQLGWQPAHDFDSFCRRSRS